MIRLAFSGGGTGGHILPNVALIQDLRERYRPDKLKILYFGTKRGMEKKMIEELKIPYQAITCGKLRRYFSLQNLVDFFKLPVGIVQALFALRRFRPQAVFCKGGYVSFPVAIAAKLLKIPVYLHESDVSPGLANKLSARFAHIICLSCAESKKFFPGKKVIVTGNPVRRDLAFGNKEDGLKFTEFRENKPILLIMGGSLGAAFLNTVVFKNFDELLSHYQIVHICGAGKTKEPEELFQKLKPENRKYLTRYRSFAFVGPELKDLYALSDLIICRAGAVTLAEISFFGKPSLLIPLPKNGSRGDQIENAEVFAKHHKNCKVLLQEHFDRDTFLHNIEELAASKKTVQRKSDFSANEKIISLLTG